MDSSNEFKPVKRAKEINFTSPAESMGWTASNEGRSNNGANVTDSGIKGAPDMARGNWNGQDPSVKLVDGSNGGY